MPSGANPPGARALFVERLDAAGEKRNGAAAVGEQPFDVAQPREGAGEQQAHDGARGVVRHFDHGGKRADAEIGRSSSPPTDGRTPRLCGG